MPEKSGPCGAAKIPQIPPNPPFLKGGGGDLLVPRDFILTNMLVLVEQ